MKKDNQTVRFCHALLSFWGKRSRAMTNYVMSLASSPSVQHPVELSQSEFCHYHYSNLPKVLEDGGVSDARFRGFVRDFLPAPRLGCGGLRYYSLTHDVTKMLKAHSPCLSGRQYVPICNKVIASDRGLGVGYPVSALHLGAGEAGWCPPLWLQRLDAATSANQAAVKQVLDLLGDASLPFGRELCLLRGDTNYGKAIFLSPLHGADNLVSIVRLRTGMKVWTRAADSERGKGAPRVYGEKYYLTEASANKTYRKKGQKQVVWQPALCEQAADETALVPQVMGNGRAVEVHIERWNNLLIRSKPDAPMKDKPLDVLRIRVLDAATHEPVFDRPMFLGLCGKRKNELDAPETQKQYHERYDVEPFYRFAKNRLLLDKLQTPCAEHLDPWLQIVQLTAWLMFVARREIHQVACPIWQQYLPKNKEARQDQQHLLTIAQVQRAAHLLFCTFDKTPFLPLKSKKGKGRAKGQTFLPRPRFKVLKKVKKTAGKPKIRQPT